MKKRKISEVPSGKWKTNNVHGRYAFVNVHGLQLRCKNSVSLSGLSVWPAAVRKVRHQTVNWSPTLRFAFCLYVFILYVGPKKGFS